MMLVLHNYFRSSSAYRVRIALNPKRLALGLQVGTPEWRGRAVRRGFHGAQSQRVVQVLASEDGDAT
jgi:hypothetical protein